MAGYNCPDGGSLVSLDDESSLRFAASATRSASPANFAADIVLHDGERIFRAGKAMFALPIKMLWEA